VAAGYAIYGPATLLVLSLGHGTHAFTLEPLLGEWVLSHPQLRIPERSCEFAIDASATRFWPPAVKRYVDECLAGRTGPRGVDFEMRWVDSPVAELHRILLRGGVCLLPRGSMGARRAGGLHRLCAAHPIAFLIEQAGGRAGDGEERLLERAPEALHDDTGLMFGSAGEVALIERYHQSEPAFRYDAPLFGRRGLFAAVAWAA
jgi:fructose-1,6-bisphosphatase I/sedoheptulose-1,7-bisphosphatase